MLKVSLKAARINSGLTLAKAAEQIGISRNTLSNYENKRTSPSVKTLEKICKIYKCSQNDIFF